MIVLDASVVIAFLDRGDALHGRATRVLLDHVEERLGANPVTLAEVLVGPTQAGRAEEVLAALEDIGVETIPFAADAPVRLASLRVQHGLRMPDCCVLLAADQTDGRVATFDARLRRAAGPTALPA